MARFSLREYSVPDYRSSLPRKDPNNAIWPRISMLAKMIHEIPWFKKDNGEVSNEELTRVYEDPEEGAPVLAAREHATEQMKGYKPSTDREAETLAAAMQGRAPKNIGPSSNTYRPDQLEYSLRNFEDTDKSNNEAVKNIQKELIDLGYDLGNYGPDKNGIDGVWSDKGKTASAYNDWKSKNQDYFDRLESEKLQAEELEKQKMQKELDDASEWASSQMEGYKPLGR